MTIQNIINNSKLIGSAYSSKTDNSVLYHYIFISDDCNDDYQIKMSIGVEYNAKAGTIDILNTDYDINPPVDGFRDAMCALGGKLLAKVDIADIFKVFE